MSMMDYAQYLNIIGRHQDALTQALHAATVDPLDSFIQANLAWRYNLAGKPEEALAEYARLQERDPEFWVGYWGHGLVLIDQGDPEAAVESLQKAVMYSEDALPAKPNYAYSLILAGRQDEAEAILEDLENRPKKGMWPPIIWASFTRRSDGTMRPLPLSTAPSRSGIGSCSGSSPRMIPIFAGWYPIPAGLNSSRRSDFRWCNNQKSISKPRRTDKENNTFPKKSLCGIV